MGMPSRISTAGAFSRIVPPGNLCLGFIVKFYMKLLLGIPVEIIHGVLVRIKVLVRFLQNFLLIFSQSSEVPSEVHGRGPAGISPRIHPVIFFCEFL